MMALGTPKMKEPLSIWIKFEPLNNRTSYFYKNNSVFLKEKAWTCLHIWNQQSDQDTFMGTNSSPLLQPKTLHQKPAFLWNSRTDFKRFCIQLEWKSQGDPTDFFFLQNKAQWYSKMFWLIHLYAYSSSLTAFFWLKCSWLYYIIPREIYSKLLSLEYCRHWPFKKIP